jgi:hypothetical protein
VRQSDRIFGGNGTNGLIDPGVGSRNIRPLHVLFTDSAPCSTPCRQQAALLVKIPFSELNKHTRMQQKGLGIPVYHETINQEFQEALVRAEASTDPHLMRWPGCCTPLTTH